MEASAMQCTHEPLYDILPLTGLSIEVFYADRTLETFGRGGAGWFWWPRRRGSSPDGSPIGPFATSYAAYRHAMSETRGFDARRTAARRETVDQLR
jgi:hypothetical protein